MEPPVLYGEYELTIDGKNRLLVPSEVRKALNPREHGEAFFMVLGINRIPWFYPDRYYRHLVSQQPSELTPDEDSLAFDQMSFAMASRLEWDKQGRVLIPDRILRRTGLGREVTMIGVRHHLELWDRAAWESQREALLARSSEIAIKAKQARQGP